MVLEQTHILTREKLFIRLYKTSFPGVARFVKTYGGSPEDAKDVFQDALVIYFEKHAKNDFSPQVNEQAYVHGIVRHLWYKKHRHDKPVKTLSAEIENTPFQETDPVVSERLLSFVERSGKKCMELLRSFYYDQLSMKEVATKFGFSGERSATAQKFKCLEKVRNSIHKLSLNKDDFYE